MTYIGRLIEVWAWKETTRGTAVAPAKWASKTNITVNDKTEYVTDEGSIGSIVDTRNTELAKTWAEGDLEMNVGINTIGEYLLWLFGTVTTTSASAWAYEHAFTLSNSNSIQSLTLGVIDPVEGDRQYPLSTINSLTLSVEEGQFVTCSINFMSKTSTSGSLTATYATDYPLLARHSAFKVAANLAWLDAADPICFKSFEITFEKNIEPDFCAGSLEPRNFINKQFAVSGSFTAVYEATTFKWYNLDGTKRAIRFEIVDSNTTIWATDNPTLSFDMPSVAFTEWDKSQGNDEVVTQTLTFKPLLSYVDGSVCEATLVNTVDTI